MFILSCLNLFDSVNVIPFNISGALNKVLNQNKLIEFENQLPSSKKKQLKEIANLVCGILNTTDQRACKEKIFDSN